MNTPLNPGKESHDGGESGAPILSYSDEDEISLLDLLTTIGEEKWTVIITALVGLLIALGFALMREPTFTSKASIMPPGNASSGGLSSQLGALAGLAGVSLGGLAATPEKSVTALLKSERLADRLIETYKLRDRYKEETLIETRLALAKWTKINADKQSGFVTIEFTDRDPKFSAEVANAYVKFLRELSGELALTDAQIKRAALEQQLDKARDTMIQAELHLRQLDRKLGINTYDVKGDMGLMQAAQIRGQIIALEVQQQAMRAFATDKNPDLIALNAQLTALRAQLAKVEDGSGVRANRLLDGSKAPTEDQVAHAKAVSEARHRSSTYEALVRQLEFARADEARQGVGLVQQVDIAVPPERRDPMKRLLMVLIGILAGGFLGLLIAFLRSAMRKMRANPDEAARLAAFKRAWGFKA